MKRRLIGGPSHGDIIDCKSYVLIRPVRCVDGNLNGGWREAEYRKGEDEDTMVFVDEKTVWRGPLIDRPSEVEDTMRKVIELAEDLLGTLKSTDDKHYAVCNDWSGDEATIKEAKAMFKLGKIGYDTEEANACNEGNDDV